MSGCGTNPARAAAGGGPYPNGHPRLHSPWNRDPVCRSELSGREDRLPTGRATSAPGVAALPEAHRSPDPKAVGAALDYRQLRDPQAPGGAGLGGETSALSPALYPYLGIVDEFGGAVLPRSDGGCCARG